MSTRQLGSLAKKSENWAQPPQRPPLQARQDSPVSTIFVDPNGKPYKFYIKDLFPNWDEDAKKQLEDGIKENGGQVIQRVPREGFVVVDPSPEWRKNFGISYKILQKCHDPVHFPCRWVIHWKFIHDTVRLGRLEERLLREYGFPASGHRPKDYAQSSAPLLKRARVWSNGKKDVFGGEDESGDAGSFKCFETTLRVHIWKGITAGERSQLVRDIQSHHGYTVPRDEADIILLPDPTSKYKYTPDDIAHLKPLIESRTSQSFQRVKFTSWIRMAIREGRWDGLWETANVTLDQLARPLEDFSALFSNKKRKRDVDEVEEPDSEESPAKVRRVEGRDSSKRKLDNLEPSVRPGTVRESAATAKQTAPQVGQPSSKFLTKVKQPAPPGKFSSRWHTDTATAPKQLPLKPGITMGSSDDEEELAAPLQTKSRDVGRASGHKDVDPSTNTRTVRGAVLVASHTEPTPQSRSNRASYKTTAQGNGARDVRVGDSSPGETPEGSQSPVTSEVAETGATAEELEPDDARTHRILTKMFAESRKVEGADSTHLPDESLDHDLVDLLEDEERILGNIKGMKEVEYAKLLDIAVIILGFERRQKRLEHGSSEEAVLVEIAGDASPTV